MQSVVGFWPFFVGITAVLGAAIYLSLLRFIFRPRKQTAREMLREAESAVAFLFDGHVLVDTSPLAKRLLPARNGGQTDWEAFIRLFSPQFPQLRVALASLSSEGHKRIVSPSDPALSLEAEWWDGYSRITFDNASEVGERSATDRLIAASLEQEVASLRAISEDAPMLIWKEDATGQIVWANNAYLNLTDRLVAAPSEIGQTWPPRNLFARFDLPVDEEGYATKRVRLDSVEDEAETWFEISSVRRGREIVRFAVDVTAVVRAEATQRAFVDTLSKTFAQLSIGLAIFGRDRRLLSFNPALLDLTGLPVEFLSARPQIRSLLDRMREARVLPEPKDYLSWRDKLAALESAAENGSYCEVWTLPNGSTYRVTGRPHPNGAIALLFEDVSADMSLTRRFRAEIELAHAALDGMRDAAVVISSAGSVIISNSAYHDLWGIAKDRGMSEIDLKSEAAEWQQACVPTPVWAMIRDFIRGHGGRDPWEEPLSLLDGRQLICRAAPLPNGYSLISFLKAPEIAQPLALFMHTRNHPVAAQ